MERKNLLKKILYLIIVLIALAAVLLAIRWLVRYVNRVPAAVISDTPFTETLTEHNGLSLTAESGSAHPGGVTLTLRNDTGADLHTHHWYGIDVQQFRDGQWYAALRRTDKKAVAMVPSVAIVYPADQTIQTGAYSWEPFLGLLEPGHYRVIWPHWFTDEAGSSVSVPLTAEFDIE